MLRSTVLLAVLVAWPAITPAIDPTDIERGKTLMYVPSLVGKMLEFYRQKQPLGEQFSLVEVPPGKAAVYLFRERHFAGSAIVIPVSIDGVPITQLQSGGFSVTLVEPGEHMIAFPERVIPPADLALPGPAARARRIRDRQLPIQIAAGFDAFLEARIKVGMNDYTVEFERREPAEASSRIAKTRRSPMPAPGQPWPNASPVP